MTNSITITREHPLFIPEIIYRIGWFLPCEGKQQFKWAARQHLQRNYSSCVQVNRLWHRTLIPLQWIFLDVDLASRRKIPLAIVQKYSHHVRYASLNSSLSLPALHSTCLRELDVASMEPLAIVYLTRSNPQLETLSIGIDRETIAISLQSILEPLAELKVLVLKGGNDTPVSLDQLVHPLSHFTKLKLLVFRQFNDLRSIDTPLPQLNISALVFACPRSSSPALPRLVRLCSKLKELTMQVVADSSALSFPSIDLSTSLRQHCLSLNQISEVHKPIPDFQPAGLLEQDHLSLFNSTSQLAHYNVSVVDFNSIFCDALLAHKSSLVLVHIYCSRASEDQFRNANTVLSSCPLLRSFALVPKRPASRPEDSLALFEKPWNCPDLMILKLLGFKPTRVDDLNQRLSEAFIAQLEHEEKHGRHLILEEQPSAADSSNASISQWTRALASYSLPDPKFLEKISQAGWTKGEKVYKDDAPVLEDERRCSSRLEKIVEEKVFERVLALPHMRDVTLEEFIYRKKARRSVPTKAISNE